MSGTTGKARTQQFVRLYDQHKAMLDAMDDEVGSLVPVDRSSMIRWLVEFGDQNRQRAAEYIRGEIRKERQARRGASNQ